MAKILIPSPLRKFTDNSSTFDTGGKTVNEAIFELADEYQGLKKHLLDENNNLRSFIRLYVGEDDINSLQNGETPVESDTVISIIPAIAGGIK
jgi:molybdopterin converting factor small subunit